MKGVVFTEFLDYVETAMGVDMVEAIIDDCAPVLSTGGAYTAVGKYPCAEMQALVVALSERSGASAAQLLEGFGERLSRTFVTAYPQHYGRYSCLFDFVTGIDSYIHVEVLKLYPDAELPRFDVVDRDDRRIVVDYRSPRGLQHLAVGLFKGSAEHYAESIHLSHQPAADGNATRFELVRV